MVFKNCEFLSKLQEVVAVVWLLHSESFVLDCVLQFVDVFCFGEGWVRPGSCNK